LVRQRTAASLLDQERLAYFFSRFFFSPGNLPSRVQTLYLIGHGTPGAMHLGSSELNLTTVNAAAAIIATWNV
jgi:hypothetical protein